MRKVLFTILLAVFSTNTLAYSLILEGVPRCEIVSSTATQMRLNCRDTTPTPPPPPPTPIACDGKLETRIQTIKPTETWTERAVSPGTVFAYEFKTTSNWARGSATMGEYIDPLTVRTMSIATKPCAFDYQSTDVLRVKSNSVRPAIPFYNLPMRANTTYYVNVTTQDAQGVETCTNPQQSCRFIMTLTNP